MQPEICIPQFNDGRVSIIYRQQLGEIEDFYNIFNIQHMSKCTFELIQRMYLFPAIDEFYLRNQSVILR